MYEFNVERCLLRLRWGRVLTLTYERLGQVVCNSARLPMAPLTDRRRLSMWSSKSCSLGSYNYQTSYMPAGDNMIRLVS